jgi:hypothetical protein
LRQQGIELNKRALSQFTKTSEQIIYTNRNQNSGKDSWNWNVGDSNEDLTWLIR